MTTPVDEKFLKKFGLTFGMRIGMIGQPVSHQPIFDAQEVRGIEFAEMDEGDLDQIWFWPLRLDPLPAQLTDLAKRIPAAGAIWLFMPKKKYAPARAVDFSWEMLQQTALKTDLVDNKVASLSETDYGSRFVIRKEHRHKYEREG
jgi:hypothetical protein